MRRQGPGLVKTHTGTLRSAMQRRIKLEHRRCYNRGAYFIAGSASATDGATPAVRLIMGTAVQTRIISNLGNFVKMRCEQEGCVEKNDDGR